jgi:hypothetical protein
MEPMEMGPGELPRTSLRDFLRILFKRKNQILIFFCATFITVAVGTFLAKSTYRATAQILVKLGRENIYLPSRSSSRKPVENALLKMQKALDVQGIKKSNVIEVSFKHTDPQIAATVVNRLSNRFLDRHLDVYKTPQSYEFFQQLQQELLRSQADLRALMAKSQAQRAQLADYKEEIDQLNRVETGSCVSFLRSRFTFSNPMLIA